MIKSTKQMDSSEKSIHKELYNSIIRNDIRKFKEILNSGFDTNYVFENGATLLFSAAARKNSEFLLTLVAERNIDPTIKDRDGAKASDRARYYQAYQNFDIMQKHIEILDDYEKNFTKIINNKKIEEFEVKKGTNEKITPFEQQSIEEQTTVEYIVLENVHNIVRYLTSPSLENYKNNPKRKEIKLLMNCLKELI